MRVIDHRIHKATGEAHPFRESPNQGGELVAPKLVVIHYTAGRSAESTCNWLTSPRAKASAHVVVGRDGSITQLVPFHRVAFHAGKSRWKELAQLNRHSIGIELDNPGCLERTGGAWRTWFQRVVDPDEVIVAAHKHGGREMGWHAFTEAQIEAALELCAALIETYGMTEVVGHEDIAPGRKRDPGPAFPMESFRARLFGRADDEDADEAMVTTTELNIRSGPGLSHAKLPSSPLRRGTRVTAIEHSGPWSRVEVLDAVDGDVGLEGWVASRLLAPAG